MSIESTSSFNLTATQIITDALTLLGVYSPNDSLSTNDFNTCLSFLNMLAKHWEGRGLHVWTTSHATMWVQYNQATYSLGNQTSDDNWANSYVETYTVSAASSGASTIVVNAESSQLKNSSLTQIINVGDYIGIQLSTGYLQWTTVTSVTSVTAGYSIGLTASLTSAVASGAYVYTYTTKPVKPLQITACSRRSALSTSQSDVIMPVISFYDYEQLTNKTTLGSPLQWKLTPNTGSADFTVWPVPNDVTQRIHFEYIRPLFDFTNSTDNPDLPQEWLLTLVYNLAVLVAPAYGKSQMVQVLAPMANQMLMELDGYDREKASLFLEPSKYRY